MYLSWSKRVEWKYILIPKYYYIPSTGELLHPLWGMNFFYCTRLKLWILANGVRWYESSLLTTFHSPFGRYRFRRLCFGINIAPEIFMKKIMEIFGDISGCIHYFDDLLIVGETREKHDEALNAVFQRARQFNVRFNSSKLQYCQSSVKFLGMIVSSEGCLHRPKTFWSYFKHAMSKRSQSLASLPQINQVPESFYRYCSF